MEYVTARGASYEAAVRKLHDLYGDSVRIHSRKTVSLKKGLFRRSGRSEIEVVGYISKAVRERAEQPKPLEQPDSGVQEVLSRLDTVSARLEELRSQPADSKTLLADEMRKLLLENEFSRTSADRLVAGALKQISPGEKVSRFDLESRILGQIVDSVNIDSPSQQRLPRIVVLMGPTGVGKTTTIAKLAAQSHFGAAGSAQRNVSIVSIDTFRIGAKSQIETFGEILSIPVTIAATPADLSRRIGDLAPDELLFIDTIGKSPRDRAIYDEMQQILSVCRVREGDARVFLALSASMKITDMLRTLELFLPFRVSSFLLTKLDETDLYGNVLSLAIESGMPLAFLTTGQRVPQDLIPAEIEFFLQRLKGFTVRPGSTVL